MRLFITVITMIFTIGCASSARNSDSVENCRTSLSGRMNYSIYWNNSVPVLIRKSDNQLRFGRIIEKQKDGYLFDHNNPSLLIDPKPRLYKWYEIGCIIDSTGEVIYGSIPKVYCPVVDMEFEIRKRNSEKYFSILIEANKDFLFCLDSGYYKIESIRFRDSRSGGRSYKADSIPELTFYVENGKVNYLGDIYLDYGEGFEVKCNSFFSPTLSINKGIAVGVMYHTRPVVTKHKIKVNDFTHKNRLDSLIVKKSILNINDQ